MAATVAPGAQTIEGFVGTALDEAKISPLHIKVISLIAAGYFFDVIDFTVFGSLVPYILHSNFATGPEVAAIGSATVFGLFIGTIGQGEFSDRFGRRFIYQFNLLLFFPDFFSSTTSAITTPIYFQTRTIRRT